MSTEKDANIAKWHPARANLFHSGLNCSFARPPHSSHKNVSRFLRRRRRGGNSFRHSYISSPPSLSYLRAECLDIKHRVARWDFFLIDTLHGRGRLVMSLELWPRGEKNIFAASLLSFTSGFREICPQFFLWHDSTLYILLACNIPR